MERESLKEYSEAATVEERRALSDEILLRGTLYVFIDAGRYFFFQSQNQGSGVLKIFQAARDFTVKEITFFDWNFC